jgi:serine/threonine protein kinase
VSTDPTQPDGAARAADDDQTVVGASMNGGAALPFGHSLQEYVIEGLVGEGGFGIVYLARDTRLGRNVALKEYMPANLATRGSHHTVSVRSERHRETFELGLRSFVNEAQLLASFDHPSLVKVYRFWEENGTAYMVMPFYQGPTLKKWLTDLGEPPDERWLLALLQPMLDALEQIHHDHCYHRDIAPDNILLLPLQGTQAGGAGAPLSVRPLLLDFGAARRVIGDMTHALTVILKPGYAPIEQYADSATMKQGPWTDVYALSAVLYACVTGRAPVPSVSRIITDDMVPAVQAGAGRYSQAFLEAIDAGLAVRPHDRPQSMAALRQLFAALGSGGVRAMPMDDATLMPSARPTPMPSARPVPMPAPPLTEMPTPAPASLAPAAPRETAALRIDPTLSADDPSEQTVIAPKKRSGSAPASPAPVSPPPSPTTASGTSTATPANAVRLGLSVLAAAVLAGGSWWWLSKKDGGTPPARSAQAPTAPATTPTTVSTPTPALPAPTAEPPRATSATTSTATAAAPPAPTPFTVLGALQDIVDRADPGIAVVANSDRPSLVIGRDQLKFRIRSSQPGYLYLYSGGTEKSHFWMLFPNKLDKDNRIEAGKELVLPRKSWAIDAGGPPGTNHIVALVSRHPRDIAANGLLRSVDAIPEFDLALAQQAWLQRDAGTGALNPLVGKARCATPPCDEAYGAKLLEITEVAAKR